MNIPGSGPETASTLNDDNQPQKYVPKTSTPGFMHFLASTGLMIIAYIIFDALLKTVIGISLILGIVGLTGFFSHAAYLYHTAKPRQILQWILWAQSCLLIASAAALIRTRLCS